MSEIGVGGKEIYKYSASLSASFIDSSSSEFWSTYLSVLCKISYSKIHTGFLYFQEYAGLSLRPHLIFKIFPQIFPFLFSNIFWKKTSKFTFGALRESEDCVRVLTTKFHLKIFSEKNPVCFGRGKEKMNKCGRTLVGLGEEKLCS
jgi:hypothetical protein